MLVNKLIGPLLAVQLVFFISCSGNGGSANDKTPPSVPSNLTAVAGSIEIDLSWVASTDNIGVAGYKVYDGTNWLQDVTTTSFAHKALTPGSQHCYTVQAFDAALNMSDPSTGLCVTTSMGGTISGTISYSGTKQGPVGVLLSLLKFDDPNLTRQDIISGAVTSGAGPYVSGPLADGTYYVAALMYTGTPGVPLKTDPWAVYGTIASLTPVVISNGFSVTGIDLQLVEGDNPFGSSPTWVGSQNWQGQYYVSLSYEDPNHDATSVMVTGPGITGSRALIFDSQNKQWNSWSVDGDNISLGTSPPPPPLEYTFTIFDSSGTRTIQDSVNCLMANWAGNLTPSGTISSGSGITFEWSKVPEDNVWYQVQLGDADSGSRLWDGPSKGQKDVYTIDYPGTLPPGSYSYNVVATKSDSIGREANCSSFAQQDFIVP